MRLLFVIPFALLLGCSSSEDNTNEGSVSRVIPAPSRSVELVEEWRLGDPNGPDGVIFSGRAGAQQAARNSRGELLIADTREAKVYRISPSGEVLDSYGAKGEGPGEYNRIGTIHLIEGDSIVVEDSYYGRLSLLGPDGDFVRRLDMPRVELMYPSETIFVDGNRIITRYGSYTTPGIEDSDSTKTEIRWIDRHTLDLDSTIVPIGEAEYLVKSSETSIRVWIKPFGRATFCASTHDTFYCGWSDALTFNKYSIEGTPLGVLEVEHVPMEIPDDVLERTKSERAIEVDFEWHKTYSAFNGLFVDDQERLWVSINDGDESQAEYWVVDETSGETFKVITQEGLTIVAVDGDRVYATIIEGEDPLVLGYRIKHSSIENLSKKPVRKRVNVLQ